jgi:membrane protease YdiL (CAAX protease family)
VTGPAIATEERSAEPRASAGTLLLVVIGIAALLLRLPILTIGGNGRVIALTCVLAAILVASLLVPIPRDQRHLGSATVLTIGLGAVAVATLVAGRPPRAPFAPLALPLSLLAAVAEEALFRRAAYGSLRRYGAVIAILGSAGLFALVHLPFYGVAALPVDLGAGLLLSWQRWASGTWTVPAGTHAAANLLAVMAR